MAELVPARDTELDRAITRRLAAAEHIWTRIDLDAMPEVDDRAILLLTTAGLVEQKVRAVVSLADATSTAEGYFRATGPFSDEVHRQLLDLAGWWDSAKQEATARHGFAWDFLGDMRLTRNGEQAKADTEEGNVAIVVEWARQHWVPPTVNMEGARVTDNGAIKVFGFLPTEIQRGPQAAASEVAEQSVGERSEDARQSPMHQGVVGGAKSRGGGKTKGPGRSPTPIEDDRKLLGDLEASGLSQRKFAEGRGISPSSISKAKKRVQDREAENGLKKPKQRRE